MKKIKVIVETGFVGCELYDEFEVEENTTKEEIEKQAVSVKNELTCDWYWEEVIGDDD
jgi:hypothetical protein|nr:MAG TPA: hypothetical protein [Caudoviricetes sp.]